MCRREKFSPMMLSEETRVEKRRAATNWFMCGSPWMYLNIIDSSRWQHIRVLLWWTFDCCRTHEMFLLCAIVSLTEKSSKPEGRRTFNTREIWGWKLMKRRILLLSRKRRCLHITLRGRLSGPVTTHFVNKPLAAEFETGSCARSFFWFLWIIRTLFWRLISTYTDLFFWVSMLRFSSSNSPPSRLISFLISN